MEELKNDYGKLRKKHGLTPTWQTIKNAIRYRDGDCNPSEVLFQLFTDSETDVCEIQDINMFYHVASLFFNAWNMLPHLALGNKSPNQLLLMRAAIDLDEIVIALEAGDDSPFIYYLDPSTMKVSFVESDFY